MSLKSCPTQTVLEVLTVELHAKQCDNGQCLNSPAYKYFKKQEKGKKKTQHVFFLLNKLLGAELYKVINNTMVNVGTEPIKKLVYSELAVAKLILF